MDCLVLPRDCSISSDKFGSKIHVEQCIRRGEGTIGNLAGQGMCILLSDLYGGSACSVLISLAAGLTSGTHIHSGVILECDKLTLLVPTVVGMKFVQADHQSILVQRVAKGVMIRLSNQRADLIAFLKEQCEGEKKVVDETFGMQSGGQLEKMTTRQVMTTVAHHLNNNLPKTWSADIQDPQRQTNCFAFSIEIFKACRGHLPSQVIVKSMMNKSESQHPMIRQMLDEHLPGLAAEWDQLWAEGRTSDFVNKQRRHLSRSLSIDVANIVPSLG